MVDCGRCCRFVPNLKQKFVRLVPGLLQIWIFGLQPKMTASAGLLLILLMMQGGPVAGLQQVGIDFLGLQPKTTAMTGILQMQGELVAGLKQSGIQSFCLQPKTTASAGLLLMMQGGPVAGFQQVGIQQLAGGSEPGGHHPRISKAKGRLQAKQPW